MASAAAKHVLITGAAIRVGHDLALGLAKAGWDITIHYNTSKEEAEALAQEISALGQTARLAQANLEIPEEVAQIIPTQGTPALTALIHNASLFERDRDDPDGTRHRAVNVDAPLMLNKAFIAQLPQGATGTIIQFLDGTPIPEHMSHYAQSRAAMEAMLPALTKDYAPRARLHALTLGPTLKNPRQSQQHFDALVAAAGEDQLTSTPTILAAILGLLPD
ncbi:MAG TPA: short-chain dehydrogenase [Rhodospirillaceae bacterium]|nr:short-chain dehydrogenase [Rhodospirillaceae bacterium]